MTDAFTAFAQDTKPAWQARKERIAETRAEARKIKNDKEQAEIDAVAAAWRRGRLEELKAGPYGEQIKQLRSFMRAMTLDSAADLVQYVAESAWLHKADADTKFDVFDMISRAVTNLRLRNGMTPFDDPLDDERGAFLMIREDLYGF